MRRREIQQGGGGGVLRREIQQGKVNWTYCCKCTRRKTGNTCNWQVKKQTRCFKNVKNLPCRYRSQKRVGWILVLFEEWAKEIDKKIQKDGRNVAR